MEALRIVAMSMILIHHFLIHGGLSLDRVEYVYPALNSFVFSGVNIFFLISGHFGIRLSAKGVTKLIVTVLFFKLVNFIMLGAVGETVKLHTVIANIVFPISGGGYWFIKSYFLLMLTSPLINAGLASLTKKQLTKVLLVFTVAIIYMYGSYASYNYLNAAYMYCIGYYLNKYNIASLFTLRQLWAIFILSCVSCSVVNLIAANFSKDGFYDYENIFILLSSISVYLGFSKYTFYNSVINKIAACSFGCYLLQDGSFGMGYFYNWQTQFFDSHGLSMELIAMFVTCFIIIWISSYVLTSFKNLWMSYVSNTIISIVARICTRLSFARVLTRIMTR